ncbi:MAG: DJ-1 family glyoxalase III [Eubacterium sp.]|nr:DJ-1 family glyoxalase III [Eubacterium sp.]
MTYIFLANGFEEIEALTVVDMFRRSGIQIKTVSVMESKIVYGAHDIGVEADILLGECDFDRCQMLIIPGGLSGCENLCNHFDFKIALRKYAESGRFIAAICAGPMVLAKSSVLGGYESTIYDGMESELIDAEYIKKNVLVSGNIITARGPAYAADFAAKLITILKDEETAREVRREMLFEV